MPSKKNKLADRHVLVRRNKGEVLLLVTGIMPNCPDQYRCKRLKTFNPISSDTFSQPFPKFFPVRIVQPALLGAVSQPFKEGIISSLFGRDCVV